VWTHGGHRETELDPLEWALQAQEAGCGEILLCSIDRDGTMEGYDLEMIARVSGALEVPVIASSGAGSLDDCLAAFEAGASAIAIASLFLFTDHSPIKVRSALWSKGVNVRASTSSRN
jgi:cyclase